MAYRWKNQRREPDYANPDLMGGYRPASEGFPQEPTFEQILGNRAYQQMQGYVPGEPDAYRQDNGDAIYAAGLMQGYRPTPAYGETAFNPATASKADIVAMQKRLGVGADGIWGKKSQAAYDAAFGKQEPYTNFGRVAGGDAGAAAVERTENMRAQILRAIADKQAELDQITNKIAEIDKATPGLAKNPREWEIAAKRAEVGDMSAYDNLVSRGNSDSSAASGIENELYNAEKLTWGLHSKSDEDIAIAKANIEASLRRAEEWAARSGKELPNSYYRLRKELASVPEAGDYGMTSREYGNELALKIYRGTATDKDIEKGVAWAEKNPNSDAAKEILEAAKAGKGKTKEAKAKAAALKKRSDDLYAQARDLSKEGLVKWWEGLGKEEREAFKKHHTIDLAKGVVQ